MKVYVSAASPLEADYVAGFIKNSGHEITSTWHSLHSLPPNRPEDWRRKIEKENDPQIRKANVLVLVASRGLVPGGKFVEVGIALGAGKRVLVLGDHEKPENKMLRHPKVEIFRSLSDLIAAI
jgi:hypothetical protein